MARVVRGPGPRWGSTDVDSVFSGYPFRLCFPVAVGVCLFHLAIQQESVDFYHT